MNNFGYDMNNLQRAAEQIQKEKQQQLESQQSIQIEILNTLKSIDSKLDKLVNDKRD